MPSRSFTIQKLVGRELETAMIPVLEARGFRVIDTDRWGYRHKRGVDVIVEINGVRCGIEFKYDLMSEQTGNVAIDLDSLNKTTSGIWIFGLPRGGEVDTYTVRSRDLAAFALQWPIKRPAGEFGQLVALVPKHTFIGQPFIYKFKTIQL